MFIGKSTSSFFSELIEVFVYAMQENYQHVKCRYKCFLILGEANVKNPVIFKNVDLLTPTHLLLSTAYAQKCIGIKPTENDDELIDGPCDIGIEGCLFAEQRDDGKTSPKDNQNFLFN